MTNYLCEHISTMIVETFPTETAERYYIPPIRKRDSVNNKSVISKGKLISMWRNRKYKNNVLLKRLKVESAQTPDTNIEGKVVKFNTLITNIFILCL